MTQTPFRRLRSPSNVAKVGRTQRRDVDAQQVDLARPGEGAGGEMRVIADLHHLKSTVVGLRGW